MNGGKKFFRKLYVDITEWRWYQNIPCKVLFIHLLLIANHCDAPWEDMVVKRGQTVRSIQRLADETGLTPKQVRGAMEKLEATGEISTSRAKKATLITVENYTKYQGGYDEEGNERATKGQIEGKERAKRGQQTKIRRLKDNNIYNPPIIPPTDEVVLIVSTLNEKAGTNYKPTTQKTRQFIQARLKEGYTVKDFEKVIITKCNEWLGTDMEKYLRPETLFGNKFENYLNQRTKRRSTGNEFLDLLGEMQQ